MQLNWKETSLLHYQHLPFPPLAGLTFLDLHQYWVKHTWPLCPYVDEWLPHTHFVRFWCSGVDSVTLTRKLCDPSALKAVWPQLRPGKSSSLYGASAPSKILHPVCCDLVRSNEWLLLLPLYSEEEKKRKRKKKHLTCTNSWEAMLVTKGLKTKHPVSAQLGKLANNVPFPLTNVWQLAFANHSLLTLWCMSWIPTGGYRRSLLTLNLPMTNGVPVNVRFLGRGRGSF